MVFFFFWNYQRARFVYEFRKLLFLIYIRTKPTEYRNRTQKTGNRINPGGKSERSKDESDHDDQNGDRSRETRRANTRVTTRGEGAQVQESLFIPVLKCNTFQAEFTSGECRRLFFTFWNKLAPEKKPKIFSTHHCRHVTNRTDDDVILRGYPGRKRWWTIVNSL